MKRNEQLSIILELLSKAVAELHDEDIERISRGTHSVEIKVIKTRTSTKSLRETESFNPLEIMNKLEEFGPYNRKQLFKKYAFK